MQCSLSLRGSGQSHGLFLLAGFHPSRAEQTTLTGPSQVGRRGTHAYPLQRKPNKTTGLFLYGSER